MSKDSGSKVKQPAQDTEQIDMNSKNYIQISGRLTSDVTPNDAKSFARFSIAHNFRSDSQDALFLDCVIFRKEFDANDQQIPWELLRKGQDILVTGRLNSNSWTDRQGQRHRGMELVLNKIRDNAD